MSDQDWKKPRDWLQEMRRQQIKLGQSLVDEVARAYLSPEEFAQYQQDELFNAVTQKYILTPDIIEVIEGYSGYIIKNLAAEGLPGYHQGWDPELISALNGYTKNNIAQLVLDVLIEKQATLPYIGKISGEELELDKRIHILRDAYRIAYRTIKKKTKLGNPVPLAERLDIRVENLEGK